MEASEFFVFTAFLLEDGLGLVLSGFEILGLVHEEERLEGGVGALAAGDAGVARWGIEDGHLWRSKAALPEGIDRAALRSGVWSGDEFIWEGVREGNAFPEAIRLRGLDATPTHFGIENVGDIEELVADDFGIESGAGAASEETVFRVGLEVDRAAAG